MSATDFSSLYSSGDVILQNPIESSAIFLVVAVMCASIEYLFSLASEVESKFFRSMFEALSEEILVFGVLSLLLTFGSSLISQLPEQWAVMFQWAHICLLFMGIMLVTLLGFLSLAVFSANRKWSSFEATKLHLPSESLNPSERKYRQACEKFRLALAMFGYEKNAIAFGPYLLKAEKQNLVALANLTWKSWLALSTLVVLNALRAKVMVLASDFSDPKEPGLLNEQGNLINVAAFVLLCGYAPLALFVRIHRVMQRGLRQFLMLVSGSGRLGGDVVGGAGGVVGSEPLLHKLDKLDLEDPQTFLLWQSLTSSIAVVQALLMFFVWYTSVFFLNMIYSTLEFNVGLTVLYIVGALVPPVAFVVLAPWTLTAIAILSSLGTCLNEKWVKELIAAKQETSARQVAATAAAETGGSAANASRAAGDGAGSARFPWTGAESEGVTAGQPRSGGSTAAPSVVWKPLRPVFSDDAPVLGSAAHASGGRSTAARGSPVSRGQLDWSRL